MRIIQTVDAQRFTLDGIQYFKNFLSYVAGTRISIYNAYDRKDVRVELLEFDQIELDGVIHPSVASLQSALLPVIYTRDSLGSLITDNPFYNKFIVVNGFALVDNTLTVNSDWQWMIQGLLYSNPAAVNINIPYTASGFKRIDIIGATSGNTFIRIIGDPVVTGATAIAPDVPANVLQATFLTVTENSISVPVIPQLGTYLGTYDSIESFESMFEFGAVGMPSDPGSFAFIKNVSYTAIAFYESFGVYTYRLIATITRTPWGTFKFVAKGQGNVNLNADEIGDLFEGGLSNGEWCPLAVWKGGALNDENNFLWGPTWGVPTP